MRVWVAILQEKSLPKYIHIYIYIIYLDFDGCGLKYEPFDYMDRKNIVRTYSFNQPHFFRMGNRIGCTSCEEWNKLKHPKSADEVWI